MPTENLKKSKKWIVEAEMPLVEAFDEAFKDNANWKSVDECDDEPIEAPRVTKEVSNIPNDDTININLPVGSSTTIIVNGNKKITLRNHKGNIIVRTYTAKTTWESDEY